MIDGLTRSQRYALRHPERRKASATKYRLENREKRNAAKREWAKRNREHVRKYQADWIARQPEGYFYRWTSAKPKRTRKPGRTKEQILANNRETKRKQAAEIHDTYLRGWMSATTGNRVKPSQWPDSLVELKRQTLKTSRIWNKRLRNSRKLATS